MKTSSCKAKGRKLQYWVAEKIAELLGVKFDQQDDLCPIHSREMGQKNTDVYIRNQEIASKFPFDVECKNTETVSLYKDVEQAKSNTKKGNQWLVVHKKNNSKPVVILDAEYFFKKCINNK